MKQKWFFQKRYRWALVGCVLSFLGPLGEWAFLSVVAKEETTIGWHFVFTEIWTFILFSGFGYLLGKSTEEIEAIAFYDALTGVLTRRYFMEQFKEILALHKRYEQPFSVMMFDLDYFKQVNDQHGHLVGDQTLKAIAKCVRSTCRESDLVGRYGGEEFLILCPNTSEEDGLHLAERIRQNIESLGPEEIGYSGPQTISMGFIALPHATQTSSTGILSLLDQALYKAKESGRNQIQLASVT